ncbi:hypothetical protein LXL04_001494 [Taraxacum kok-saghyz]
MGDDFLNDALLCNVENEALMKVKYEDRFQCSTERSHCQKPTIQECVDVNFKAALSQQRSKDQYGVPCGTSIWKHI